MRQRRRELGPCKVETAVVGEKTLHQGKVGESLQPVEPGNAVQVDVLEHGIRTPDLQFSDPRLITHQEPPQAREAFEVVEMLEAANFPERQIPERWKPLNRADRLCVSQNELQRLERDQGIDELQRELRRRL